MNRAQEYAEQQVRKEKIAESIYECYFRSKPSWILEK